MAFGYDGSVRIKADLNHFNFDRGMSHMTKSVDKFSGTLKKAAGIIGAVFGVAAVVNFGKEAVKAASALNDAWMGLESIVAGLMTIVGSALAGAGIGFAIGNVPGAIAGAIIGLVAGVVIEITGIKAAGEAAYAATEDFQVMTKILDECEDSANRSSAAMETLERNVDNLTTSLADVGAAQQLVDEIYSINENANASAYELELMATKVELLNSMGLDGLHLTIDETTGRIVETKEATDQLILSLQKEAETAALQELLVQAYKDRYQAVSDAEKAVKKIDAAEQALAKTEHELTNTPWWDLEKHSALTAQQEKQTEALEAANDARDKAVTAYDELSGAIETYSGALTDLEEPEASVGVKLEERMDIVRQTVQGVADDMPGYGKNISEGLENGMSDGLKEENTKNIFGKIGDWFKDFFGIHSPSTVFKEFGGFLMAELHNGLEGALEPINKFFSDLWENVQRLASDAWDGIVGIWETVSDWFNENIIEPVSQFFSDMWEDIKQFASDAWDGIVGVWEAVSGWFDEHIIQPVSEFFGDMWEGIRQGASDLWDKIVGVWEKASSWFEEHVTKPIGDAFEAVGEFIKGVFNGIIGTVEGMINGVIKGINWLIEQLNKISFDVPDWVPDWAGGGKKFGINIPKVSDVKLPRLANGAVIPPNQQFAAVLGDQRSGMNIEAPLKTIEQAVRNVMGEAGFGGDINITVESILDGKVVARNTVRHINAMTRSSGRPVLLT